MIYQDKDTKRQNYFDKVTDRKVSRHSARFQNAHKRYAEGKNAVIRRNLRFWFADKVVKVLTNPYTKKLLLLYLK